MHIGATVPAVCPRTFPASDGIWETEGADFLTCEQIAILSFGCSPIAFRRHRSPGDEDEVASGLGVETPAQIHPTFDRNTDVCHPYISAGCHLLTATVPPFSTVPLQKIRMHTNKRIGCLPNDVRTWSADDRLHRLQRHLWQKSFWLRRSALPSYDTDTLDDPRMVFCSKPSSWSKIRSGIVGGRFEKSFAAADAESQTSEGADTLTMANGSVSPSNDHSLQPSHPGNSPECQLPTATAPPFSTIPLPNEQVEGDDPIQGSAGLVVIARLDQIAEEAEPGADAQSLESTVTRAHDDKREAVGKSERRAGFTHIALVVAVAGWQGDATDAVDDVLGGGKGLQQGPAAANVPSATTSLTIDGNSLSSDTRSGWTAVGVAIDNIFVFFSQ
ncbi:hypothetical protein BDK51DRAFT_47713 [Blyttiomyces helicus]|uniref:Uncharacterized protein n=1 Tax=Blyttiomyces helicus TaxID=388810 RepID=A0A4P9W9P6_9FUNG|nr:hypothetical protein BDK51DRAFT_47713 [Blyttiomyces helicus]|eukprot:RKO87540.1 hypothetical protein BDK51DRAFT_47713 [Blyttiomyces helicus]